MKAKHLFPILMMPLILSCSGQKAEADLILTNGHIYTVDPDFSVAEAMAIRNGRILATGTSEAISASYRAERHKDLKGAFVYPGWIDAHCHFYGYGLSLNAVDLMESSSVEEIIERIKLHRKTHSGPWITGRGWDQNDWTEKAFPTRQMLDQHFPDTPILLRRIDGHAAWVNSKALELAGITGKTDVEGGEVVLEEGKPSGILIDNAIGLVRDLVPPPGLEEQTRALKAAQEKCFSLGLTSVCDAGLDKATVLLIDSLQQSGELLMRISTWLAPTEENFRHFVDKGPVQNERLSINTIKLFADGALGSRGARMLSDYSDDPGNRGLLITDPDSLEAYCRRAYEHGFSIATHCIGDEANRQTLKRYAKILGGPNDRRWRIEHAQIIHPDDFHYFADYAIVPSVQTTHATSDMYWAGDRIGPERMKGAYAYRKLLEQNGWLPNGSDFPVEYVNPLFGFYAGVVRKDRAGYPSGGFQMVDALTREEALRAMTIWAARASFEEAFKGSLEAGKLADFVITGTDLMKAPEDSLFAIPVEATYSGGKLVYQK